MNEFGHELRKKQTKSIFGEAIALLDNTLVSHGAHSWKSLSWGLLVIACHTK